MLSYAAAGPPTLFGDTAAAELLARSEDDDAEDAREHDLARRPADDRFLAIGRAAGPLRPILGGLQTILMPVLTPLALLGAVVLLMVSWRSALLLLGLPLYYLSTESFFLYEWRVAVPMHYALFACAAVPLVLGWGLVRAARDRAPQNQAG